jgi:hypothetical protein
MGLFKEIMEKSEESDKNYRATDYTNKRPKIPKITLMEEAELTVSFTDFFGSRTVVPL